MSSIEWKFKAVLEVVMSDFENVIICGDMNARVGDEQICDEGGNEK